MTRYLRSRRLRRRLARYTIGTDKRAIAAWLEELVARARAE